ncbi:hypothetical protein L3Y34_019380 [Caenorhabditis briggsae]|uniref:Uncharacterized protein n=1 Tax=Caenorhabditis briggsae TaxID=6238 RepID=A0AAE9DNZ8_CAEBR|nr:hypothetical protein L3Y34_019380 [Caenorhabditis briggsae]
MSHEKMVSLKISMAYVCMEKTKCSLQLKAIPQHAIYHSSYSGMLRTPSMNIEAVFRGGITRFLEHARLTEQVKTLSQLLNKDRLFL